MGSEDFVTGPQGRLRVQANRDPGEEPVIVFIHADLGRLEQWGEARGRLDDKFRTVALDRRGHGKSDLPRDGRFGARDSADDISAVLDGLKIGQAILVAHSGGTLGAWTFAVDQPDRVRGLLMVDPPLDSAVMPKEIIDGTIAALRGPDFGRAAEQYYSSIAGPDGQVAERVVADALATPQETMIGTFEALRDFKPTELAGGFAGPIRSLVQPSLDVDGAFHRFAPGFPYLAVPGTGHWIQLDAPDAFAQCLDHFIGETSRPR